MAKEALGKIYSDGELVVRQGEKGDCMYVIQKGRVEIFREEGGSQIPLRVASTGEFFGEMALVERMERSASVRAVGEARILTVDKRTFMRRVHEDPSLAFRIMESLSHEIRRLAQEVAELKVGERNRK
jgi:CRP-like cAMP-binding protein